MKYFTIIIAAIVLASLFSCEKDPIESSDRIAVQSFASEQDLLAATSEVDLLRLELEEEIRNEILRHTVSDVPTKQDVLSMSSASSSDEELKRALLQYHSMKIDAIHKERNERQFTSIQSIADEVNSLKIIDFEKHEALLVKYHEFLTTDKYGVITRFQQTGLSNMINTSGELLVEGQNVALESENNPTPLKAYRYVDNGTVAMSPDGKFVIVYQTGQNTRQGNWLSKRTVLYTKLTSYLWIENNYYNYPAWFFTDPESFASWSSETYYTIDESGFSNYTKFEAENMTDVYYYDAGLCHSVEVPFISAVGLTAFKTKDALYECEKQFYRAIGLVGGSFCTSVNGVWYTATGHAYIGGWYDKWNKYTNY